MARLGRLLTRIRGRIRLKPLPKLSPFSVPMMMEIGRERSPGGASDMILASASLSALITEAMA